jgi:hypothetical protein
MAASKKPDAIQRQIWIYGRFIVSLVFVFWVGRWVLPKLPILQGWQNKFTISAIEIGKQDIPDSALRPQSAEEIVGYFKPEFDLSQNVFHLDGPLLIAAWRCQPLNTLGACVRYVWKGESITVVITKKPTTSGKPMGAFTRAAWGGYFVNRDGLSASIVGPFDALDLRAAWPYAK